jgi:hypothetical protein
MILTIFIGFVVAVCLVSSLIFYVFMRSQNNIKRSSSINEKQQIKYSLRPSMDIITKTLSQEFPFRTSMSSTKSNRSSSTISHYEENEFNNKKQHKSAESIHSLIVPFRSTSVATNLSQPRRPHSTNWRQGSIVDPNQMALIQFSLPPSNNNKYRRRSVAVCNNIIEKKENPIPTIDSTSPCLISFSITYLKSSQIKIQFHSLS